MYISFLFPYEAKYSKAVYLWVFYKQLTHFDLNQIIFIGNENYFLKPSLLSCQEPTKFELLPATQTNLGYRVPPDDLVENAKKYIINSDLFEELEKRHLSNNMVWKEFLTRRIPELEERLTAIFDDIVKQYPKIDAVLSWCNVPSLNFVATRYAIPVIYNELGALRKPYYYPTAYFDFSGVNGNTEAERRFEQFQKELQENPGKIPIMERDELLSFITGGQKQSVFELEDSNEFDIGIPLQVEDDSNVIAYSNGLTNFELIQFVKKKYSKNVLIRRHPAGYMIYDNERLGPVDTSRNSIEFIKRCKQIVTINSSTAFEAALLGKRVSVLGDASFRMLSDLTNEEEIKVKLNFLVFGYLIPYQLVFDEAYYNWRLTKPSEIEIYLYHHHYYLKLQAIWEQAETDSGVKSDQSPENTVPEQPEQEPLLTMLKQLDGKKLVIFGTGSASRTISNYLRAADYYVDNDSQKWDQPYQQTIIKNPQCLLEESPEQLVILVASQFYLEIAAGLRAMGFEENIHFWDGAKLFHLY